VNRLAAAGGAPAGAVGLAISGVLRNGIDRLHELLRTSSYRKMTKAKDGLFKVFKELHRATHMEDDIGRIFNEVRAAGRVASADEPFVFNDGDESGGQSAHGSLEAGPLHSGAGADAGGVRLLKAEDHHAPHGRRGGGGAACHRERGIEEVELHPGGAVAPGERPPGLVLPARGNKGEVAWVRGDVGEDLRQQREGGVGPLFFEVRVDRERRGAAARGVRGGQGNEPGPMGGRGGGEQVDHMRAPDSIECLEGGASQGPAGSRRVFGEFREEGRCPKGGDSIGGRCRGDSDEQAVDIVDRADGGDDSSVAEADRLVAEVSDFNAEALPQYDNGQASYRLTAVVRVEAVVQRDQYLTSEACCDQHGRTGPWGQHPPLRETHPRIPWGSAAFSLAAFFTRQDGHRSIGGPYDAVKARVQHLDVAFDETGAEQHGHGEALDADKVDVRGEATGAQAQGDHPPGGDRVSIFVHNVRQMRAWMQPPRPTLGQSVHPNDRGPYACVQGRCQQPHPCLFKAEGRGDGILPGYRGQGKVYPYFRTLRAGGVTGWPSC